MGRLVVMGLIVVPILYVLSLGPVFSYYVNGDKPMPMAMYQSYRPLFHFIPEASSRYLAYWNVSEIEAFFVTDTPGRVVERNETAKSYDPHWNVKKRDVH